MQIKHRLYTTWLIWDLSYAIFSDGERQGTLSSSSSSLSSISPSSSWLSEAMFRLDVTMSGTGRIDGLLLPVCCVHFQLSLLLFEHWLTSGIRIYQPLRKFNASGLKNWGLSCLGSNRWLSDELSFPGESLRHVREFKFIVESPYFAANIYHVS